VSQPLEVSHQSLSKPYRFCPLSEGSSQDPDNNIWCPPWGTIKLCPLPLFWVSIAWRLVTCHQAPYQCFWHFWVGSNEPQALITQLIAQLRLSNHNHMTGSQFNTFMVSQLRSYLYSIMKQSTIYSLFYQINIPHLT